MRVRETQTIKISLASAIKMSYLQEAAFDGSDAL